MSLLTAYWIFVGLVVLAYLAILYFLIGKHLSPLAGKLLIALTITQLILLVANALVFLDRVPSATWQWLLNIDMELSLGTLLSSAQLMCVGLLAFWLALRSERLAWWVRLYWCMLGALFVFLSLDEYFSFHEAHLATYRFQYAAVGVAFVILGLLAYRFGMQSHKRLFAFLFGGLAVMGAGGIGGEPVVWEFVCHGPIPGLGPICHQFSLFEEFGEVLGSMLVLLGVVSFLEDNFDGGRWKWSRRILFSGGAMWLIVMIANVWPLPAIEAQYFAEPVNVEYLDGRMSLIAYRLSDEEVKPGETLTLALYWRANDQIPHSLALSAHVLTADDVHSVAQVDEMDIGRSPSYAWISGVVVRRVVRITLPDDLDVPRSYLVMIRPWQSGVEVSINESDRRLIRSDTVILDSVVALPVEAPPSPQVETAYHFVDGIILYGYRLPEVSSTDQPVEMAFWWQVQEPIERDLVQFVHLMQRDGDYVVIFDRPPFGGVFPTYNWTEGMRTQDMMSVPLPDDLPAGEYEVYTGLYEWPSLERVSVVENGQSVQDNRIYLGTIVIRSSR